MAALLGCGRKSFAAPPPVADNEDSSTPIRKVEVGYDGAFKVGVWTPIRVEVAPGTKGEVSVTASDPDGRPVRFPLQESEDSIWTGEFQSGRLDAPIQVSFRNGGGESRSRTIDPEDGLRARRQSTRFWLLWGNLPGFELAAEDLNAAAAAVSSEPQIEVIRRPFGGVTAAGEELAGIDAIVLSPGDLPGDQVSALRDWVWNGGRVVLVLGEQADAAVEFLPRWFPVTAAPATRERQGSVVTSRITAFVPKSATLRTLDDPLVTPVTLRDGAVLVEGPATPLVTRSAVGLGLVTVVAMDLSAPPFLSPARSPVDEKHRLEDARQRLRWASLPQFCLLLAGEQPAGAEADAARLQPQLSPTGISDVQSQLASVLDHFPGVERASSWNVIGLMGLYLLIVGPVDYLLVHRLFKRPHLTWVTLPLWVLLASWWSTAYASRSNGIERQANQLEVLDVGADAGVQRLTSWFSLYSPETKRYDVGVAADLSEDDAASAAADRTAPRLCWMSRPEEGFRGMYRRGGIEFGSAGFAVDPALGIADDVPVPVWSSLEVSTETSTVASGKPLASCREVTAADGALLRRELTHNLDGDITDWFAVENVQVHFPMQDEIATLRPGQPVDLLRGCAQQLLRSFIQGESTTSETTKTGTQTYVRREAYDPLSLDPRRLFRTLSFFEAVGGRAYTGLTNQTLRRLDFSDVIHLDRLVVFGRLQRPLSSYSVDGARVEPRERTTYVRLVVPIVRERLAARAEDSSP